MTFIELATLRQSTRKYSPVPVEREKLLRCLEAARIAPSACNSQPWKFIVVDDPELRMKVARETYNALVPINKFTHQAPVLVVLVVERPKTISQIGGRIKNKDYWLYDIGIAAEHFCLQAAEEGLGTCMLGWFNERPLQILLGIPKKRLIGLVITVGYPADEPRPKIRKTLDSIVAYNKYE